MLNLELPRLLLTLHRDVLPPSLVTRRSHLWLAIRCAALHVV
jgi:hypothetical protein